MSNRQQRRARRSSPLAAHTQHGSRFVPPLLAAGGTHQTSWARDILPDFIWLSFHISEDPLEGMHVAAGALDVIDDTLATLGETTLSCGRLSQFEEISEASRGPILEALKTQGIYDSSFPECFANALGAYPDAPGSWLLDPWRQRGLNADTEAAGRTLEAVITKTLHVKDLVSTRTQYVYLRGLIKAEVFTIGPDLNLGDYLHRYPYGLSDDELKEAEPTFRALFQALVGRENPSDTTVSSAWSKTFWRLNWSLYPCARPLEPVTMKNKTTDQKLIEDLLNGLHLESAELQERFNEVALSTDPDLYTPDRYEVLTGITARVLRLVDGAVASPLLWTDEYGSNLFRSIIEAKILIRWLAEKNDQELYSRFKSYGRGKLKLLKLHTEEYVDALDDVPEHLEDYLDLLSQEVNADIWEEYQEISLAGTFSGTSAHKMAVEVGLENDYNFVFAPASGSTHGDWTSLDRYALVRCVNPLHRWHRIPDFSPRLGISTAGIETALALAGEVVTAYTNTIGVSQG